MNNYMYQSKAKIMYSMNFLRYVCGRVLQAPAFLLADTHTYIALSRLSKFKPRPFARSPARANLI
jgi:hypothetical protein